MVISWILNTVSEDISNGMDFVSYAKELWDELMEQFSSTNGHRVLGFERSTFFGTRRKIC